MQGLHQAHAPEPAAIRQKHTHACTGWRASQCAMPCASGVGLGVVRPWAPWLSWRVHRPLPLVDGRHCARGASSVRGRCPGVLSAWAALGAPESHTDIAKGGCSRRRAPVRSIMHACQPAGPTGTAWLSCFCMTQPFHGSHARTSAGRLPSRATFGGVPAREVTKAMLGSTLHCLRLAGIAVWGLAGRDRWYVGGRGQLGQSISQPTPRH